MPTATKTSETPWRAARELQGISQDEMYVRWRTFPMPESIRAELRSTTTAQRFDNGKTDISPVAKSYYAEILGVPLRAIDKQAADDLERILERMELPSKGSTKRRTNKTCNSAFADVAA